MTDPETCICGHSLLAHNDLGHCKGRFYARGAMCDCARYEQEVGA